MGSDEYYVFWVCVCVFVAFGIQRAMRMRNIVMCGLSGSTIFFHIVSKMAWFSKKKKILKIKCVLIFCTNFVWNIFHSMGNCTRLIIDVYWCSCNVPPLLLRYWWNLNFLDKFKKKYTNIKFYENPSCVSRVVLCAQTDVTKHIVAFRNFSNAPKNYGIPICSYNHESWPFRWNSVTHCSPSWAL